jgi:HSP20 family protein
MAGDDTRPLEIARRDRYLGWDAAAQAERSRRFQASPVSTRRFHMYASMLNFPGSLFGNFEQLRRELDDLFQIGSQPTSIRSVAPGTFPAVNIGHTPASVEVYAFAPGIDPAKVEVVVDRGVLTLEGERSIPQPEGRATVYSRERVGGRFKRAISLPEDIDPENVKATYRDGVLRVSIARRAEAQPKRITIQ